MTEFCERCNGDGNEPCTECWGDPDIQCDNIRHDDYYMPEPCSGCGGTGEARVD